VNLPLDPRLTAAVAAFDAAKAGKRSKTAHRAAVLAAVKAYAGWSCKACNVAHRGPFNGCDAPE
jgi:hypothetical protein